MNDSLLAKYLDGSATDRECAEVEAWIAESADNRALFEQFEMIWRSSAAGKNDTVLQLDKQAALLKVKARIAQDTDTKNAEPTVRNLSAARTYFMRVAAILAVLLSAGFLAVFIYRAMVAAPDSVQFAALQQNEELHLPDSSVIHLQVGSEISYASNFETNRKLTFSGQGFFDVQKRVDAPFTIALNDLEVAVLGTSFYIIALENDSVVEVGVQSGRVQVAEKAGGDTLILNAHETVRYNTSTRRFSKVDAYNLNKLFWKTKVLEFNEQRLDEVLQILEEVYQTEIDFDVSALHSCNFTGRFKDASLAEILSQLQATFNLEITQAERIRIEGKPCEE